MNATLYRTARLTATIALIAIICACTKPSEPPEAAASRAAPASDSRPLIDHVAPPRDSVGGVPQRFVWSPVEGADRYAIGLWNDVDVLVWRLNDLRAPSVDWPVGGELVSGTYFWSVTAYRDDRAMATSGLAAFVVR